MAHVRPRKTVDYDPEEIGVAIVTAPKGEASPAAATETVSIHKADGGGYIVTCYRPDRPPKDYVFASIDDALAYARRRLTEEGEPAEEPPARGEAESEAMAAAPPAATEEE